MSEELEDIKRWYQEHGMPYVHEDWQYRDETGESATRQTQPPEERGGQRFVPRDPTEQWWWERQHFPWRPRTFEEREWQEVLEDFFTPYIAMMARPKANLLWQVFGVRATYADAGASEGISRQAAQQAVKRAVRDLTKRIAMDDVLYRPPTDGRRRDYEEEQRAAKRVFMVYLARRRSSDSTG